MRLRARFHLAVLGLFVVSLTPVSGQLFENLKAISSRMRVGSPEVIAKFYLEGPKGVLLEDFDLDGRLDFATSNSDGTLSLGYGISGREFEEAVHLQTGASSLREIGSGDLNGDGLVDIAAADPFDGEILLFINSGSRAFELRKLPTWPGARNFVIEDLDSDGVLDFCVGGVPVGVRYYRGDGGGGFTDAGSASDLVEGEEFKEELEDIELEFGEAKPVFTLRVRDLGGEKQLLVTNAFANRMAIYGLSAEGQLISQDLLIDSEGGSFDSLHHFELARVAGPLGSEGVDIIAASKFRNAVIVWRGRGVTGPFETTPHQVLPVEGGPRAVRLTDLDGDGWNDLVVVQRYFDRLSLFRNVGGQFEYWDTLPTGRSPRDVAVEDVDGDGRLDFCVANRRSSDVSLLFGGDDGGFEFPTRLYQVDGEVGGLLLRDLDSDGLDDVLQMHRATGDISVRRSPPQGKLDAAVFYPMGIGRRARLPTLRVRGCSGRKVGGDAARPRGRRPRTVPLGMAPRW